MKDNDIMPHRILLLRFHTKRMGDKDVMPDRTLLLNFLQKNGG